MNRLLIVMLLTVLVGCVRGGGMFHMGGTVIENRSSHTVVFTETCGSGSRKHTLKPGKKMSIYDCCNDWDIKLHYSEMDSDDVKVGFGPVETGRTDRMYRDGDYMVYETGGGHHYQDCFVTFYEDEKLSDTEREKKVKYYLEWAEGCLKNNDYHNAIELAETGLKYSKWRSVKGFAIQSRAYYMLGEYDDAWDNVHYIQSLGGQVDAEFLENLRKASEKIIFSEEFTDNKNNWPIADSSERSSEIYNGYYFLEHKRNDNGWSWRHKINVPNTRDFVLETSLARIYGESGYGYGLRWGISDADNYYEFNIADTGYCRYSKNQNGKYIVINPWKACPINKGNQLNRLTVKKVGSKLEFYINDYRIFDSEFEKWFGNNIGFNIYRNIMIIVDYIVVREGT